MKPRKYKYPRAKGFAQWRPRRKAALLVARVREILQEYREHLPLTCRQIYYRLVGADDYPKTEAAYKELLETLNRARRAGLVGFDAIRDDGVTESLPSEFDDLAAFWKTVRYLAQAYRRDRQAGQPRRVELWVEAGGMVPQAARVAHPYGVPVYSSGGFDSVTAKYHTARRIAGRDQPTVVLHVGDHDPSGVCVFDSAAADIAAFLDGLGCPEQAEFVRVAVTPEQIGRYGLVTAPAKATDKRGDWTGGTVQAEAFSPDELAREIHAAIEDVVDLDILDELRDTEQAERMALVAQIEGLLP